MGRVIYQYKDYAVRMTEKGYKLYYKEDEQNCHGHLKDFEKCVEVIDWMTKHKIPKSKYLRETVRRVSKPGPYKDLLERKAERDRDRPPYRNINKGVR